MVALKTSPFKAGLVWVLIAVGIVAIMLQHARGAAWAGAAAAPTDIVGAAPVYREIKDWVVVCDNTRVCFAKYSSGDLGGEDTGYLSVARDPGPRGRLVVSIEDWDEEHAPDPLTLELDGRPVAERSRWKTANEGQVDSLEGAAALGFLRSIADGQTLSYGAARNRSAVSLAGMKAALLVIDEDQGRLGAEDAFVRVGAKPASSAFAAPPVPILHAAAAGAPLANAAAFAAAVRRAKGAELKHDECETAPGPQGDQAFALGRADVLVFLDCLDGPYQSSFAVFIAPRNSPEQARPPVLPQPPTARANADPLAAANLVSVDWDPKTSTLSESSRGRGLADCGSSIQWVYDGARFHVATYNALNRCSGGPPGDWPTVYRTDVVIGP